MQNDANQDRENRKTIAFVLVALVAMVIAWEPWRRTTAATNVPLEVGRKLFEDFKDPLAAKSLEITKFDEVNATIHQFTVAQHDGVWSIPSHNNYPADAREHMAQAATSLLDLEILNVASDRPGDQELYGVVAPEPQKLRPGMIGVGSRVTMKDDKDKVLADLIIGKEIKDQPGLRYVRREGRDQIYKVAIKTDKLSTKFEDWIERDLLKLNAFDVRKVELNDYSIQESMAPTGEMSLGLEQRGRIRLAYDDSTNNWNLVELTEFDPEGKPVPVTLADDEELNAERLNNMKSALDDLQIVDVERKPAGLSQDLRASDEFVNNAEAQRSLFARGFFYVNREIYSSEGEATCTTKDGVRYVLRFGHLAGGSDDKAEPGEEGDKKNPALNRYLFVMAQFDPTQIPEPQLEPVPGDDAATEPAETKTAAQEPAEAPKVDDKAAADKPAEDQPEAKPAPPPTPEEERRIMIRRENKRRQEEYKETLKKGEDKVKDLNERFADWYFIISDDVYKKIHLGRADVVKKKGKQPDEPEMPRNELLDLQRGIR